MAAYFVIYYNITDSARFMEYFQAVIPVILRRGGRLVVEGTPEAIEGTLSFKQAVVFLTFHVKSWKAEEKRVLAKVDYGRYSG